MYVENVQKQVIDTGDMMLLATPNVMDFVTVRFFTISKSDRFDRFRMLFLGIVIIQISQVMFLSCDWSLLESVYLSKYLIQTTPKSESSPLD